MVQKWWALPSSQIRLSRVTRLGKGMEGWERGMWVMRREGVKTEDRRIGLMERLGEEAARGAAWEEVARD